MGTYMNVTYRYMHEHTHTYTERMRERSNVPLSMGFLSVTSLTLLFLEYCKHSVQVGRSKREQSMQGKIVGRWRN